MLKGKGSLSVGRWRRTLVFLCIQDRAKVSFSSFLLLLVSVTLEAKVETRGEGQKKCLFSFPVVKKDGFRRRRRRKEKKEKTLRRFRRRREEVPFSSYAHDPTEKEGPWKEGFNNSYNYALDL